MGVKANKKIKEGGGCEIMKKKVRRAGVTGGGELSKALCGVVKRTREPEKGGSVYT